MPSPLLTIAIPTFNRAPFLATTLEMFSKELERVPAADVALLIIDNCSTDGTADIVDRLARSRPGVTYIRNSENVGAERNIMACALTSEGEFTWVFGDDDIPVPGMLSRILERLRTDKGIDVYFLNYMQTDQKMTGIICSNVLQETDEAELGSLKDFFRYPGAADVIGFIGSVIFRTAPIRSTSFETYVGFESYYGHFGALMEGFHGSKCRYFGTPMVVQRQGNQRVDAEQGPRAHTFKAGLPAFLGFLRILDRLLEKGALVPGDLDTLTGKRFSDPFPTDCVGILDWWIERGLRDPLMNGLSSPDAAYDRDLDHIHRIVSGRDFGASTLRLRDILEQARAIRAAQAPADRS